MVGEFGGKVRFTVDNYGDSALAKKFGITRYPAIFVDDILVATPDDFGFYGKGGGHAAGRYAPLKSVASHERFRADLSKTIRLVLAGRGDAARSTAAPASAGSLTQLPEFSAETLDGKRVTAGTLGGRVVLVDFWATWCPPCRGTLSWLDAVKKKHGDRVAIVTVAVESPADAVRQLMSKRPGFVSVTGTPALAQAFGDVSALPTLFIFDGSGRIAGTFYGAPPTLHADAERAIARALAGGKR